MAPIVEVGEGAAPVCGQESAAAATTENTDGCFFAVALILTGVATVAVAACKVAAVFPPWIEGAKEGERSTPVVTEAPSFIAELFPGGVFECKSPAATVTRSSFEAALPTEEVVAFSRSKPSSGGEGLAGGESSVAGFS